MTRNLKVLGLALAAVFAMTAVFASGAQATHVTVSPSPAILTGEAVEHPLIGKTQTFKLAGGQTLSCNHITFGATVKNGDTEITVAPTYTECSALIGSENLPATVTMNDCDYDFKGGTETSSTTFHEVEVKLTCTPGKKVEIHVYKKADEKEELCTYSVAEFAAFKKGNEIHNEVGTPNSVLITSTVTEIATTRTGSLLCGAASTNATYTGSTTVRAFEDKGGKIEDGTEIGLEEGAQGSVTISK